MKKFILSGPATVLIVASCVLFPGFLASCTNAKSQPAAPGGGGVKGSLTCIKCVAVALSQDTSGPGGGPKPKIFLTGRTLTAIPANTEIRVEVILGKYAAGVKK